jgi:hypothetical protein
MKKMGGNARGLILKNCTNASDTRNTTYLLRNSILKYILFSGKEYLYRHYQCTPIVILHYVASTKRKR